MLGQTPQAAPRWRIDAAVAARSLPSGNHSQSSGAGRISRRMLVALPLIALALAACTQAAPDQPAAPPPGSPPRATAAVTATATAAATVSTPTVRPAGAASDPAVDWTIIRLERVQRPDRYRFTVVVRGQERTFDGSRVCYEIAVPGQVLPERIQTALGYEVECRLEN